MSIDFFQARFAFVNTDDGTLTPEAYRMLRTWFARIGGSNGTSTEQLDQLVNMALQTFSPDTTAQRDISDLEINQPIDQSAQLSILASRCDELQAQLSAFNGLSDEVAALRHSMMDIEQTSSYRDPFRVDWERPGKIGAGTANTVRATTVTATGQITSTLAVGTAPLVVASTTKVANLNVDQLDGGDWAAPGAIGAGTANTGAFTTLTTSDQISAVKNYSVAPAVRAISTAVSGASSFAATNSDASQFLVGYSGSSADPTQAIYWNAGQVLRFATATSTQAAGFTIVATLDASGFKSVTGFGCNGKAAQTAFALGAAASDLVTVIALANNLRTMAINNGTGS